MLLLEKTASLFLTFNEKTPLVHQITNNVTVNDCANITLAIGGSPVMASTPEEVEDMVQLDDALVINFGDFGPSTYEAMLRAGRAANKRNIPVIFDPVGVGATRYRTEKAQNLIKEVKVSVVRGNTSEVFSLIGGKAITQGVDAGEIPITSMELAQKAANELGCVVVVSGKVDVVSNGVETVQIYNGDEILTKVTGTGCMSTALIGCFAGITDDTFLAAIAGISVMGIAGERAKTAQGLGTFRVNLIDEISKMDKESWEKGVRIE